MDPREADAVRRAKERAGAARQSGVDQKVAERGRLVAMIQRVVDAVAQQPQPDTDVLVVTRTVGRVRVREVSEERAGWKLASYDNGHTKSASLCLLLDGTLAESPRALFRNDLDVYIGYYGASSIEAGLAEVAARIGLTP